MSPHFRFGHNAVIMSSLIVALTIIAIVRCNGANLLTLSTTIGPEDTNGRAIENEYPKETFSKTLSLSRDRLMKMEKPTSLANDTSGETNKRKPRLLGSLAFLAGLGGLATAAASTVKTFAKLPQASFSLNLGSKTSPHIAAYYNPYSLPFYPFFFPGSFGLVPIVDPAKPQTMSHKDSTQQVISVFEKQPSDFADDEEYGDEEKKSDRDRSDEDDPKAGHSAELRVEGDWNAEGKVTSQCKEEQKKRGFYKGSSREREDFQVNENDLRRKIIASKTRQNTGIPAPMQNLMQMSNSTSNPTINSTPNPTTNSTQNPVSNHTEYPYFPGYFGGHPHDISNVEFTTDSDTYQYHDHGQIGYNFPHDRPPNFYHDNNYNLHSNSYPYFPGSFPSDRINQYVNTDFNHIQPPEYQPSYVNGFKPVK